MSSEANFPTECLEDIFRHLKGKDLLKCTLVCPDWNEFVETTASCLEKFRLNIHGTSNLSEIVQKFHQSLNNRKLTRVSVECIEPESATVVPDFLQMIQSTVKELKLSVFWKTENRQHDASDFQFP